MQRLIGLVFAGALRVVGSHFSKGDLQGACANLGLPVHIFEWNAATESSGIARDAGYLVRPDGHVALAPRNADQVREPDRALAAASSIQQPKKDGGAIEVR